MLRHNFSESSILKKFLRSVQKWPKLRNGTFFSTHLKNKTLGPKSSVIYDIWGLLPIKVDLHPPGTPKPSKNTFLLQQDHVFWGFGVPGGCKSTLIGKSPHISYITELFGPRVLFFEMGRKKNFVPQFWPFLHRP